MAALAGVFSRLTGIEIDVDSLRSALIFCGAGLSFSLILIAHGFDLGVASTEGTRETWGGEAARQTHGQLRCYSVSRELRGIPMADGDIETLMKARAALARSRLSWAQTIATPGEIPEMAIRGIINAQRAIDVINRAMEEREDVTEPEAEEEAERKRPA
jgi:hypothetical protein